MNKKLSQSTLALLVGLCLPLSAALACSEDGKSGFFPENSLRIPARPGKTIEEARFNAAIDRAEAFYKPIFAAQNRTLVINRKWSDPTVNASASRSLFGRKSIVNMYGGLARHNLVTADAFMLVLCHELGHHLGGIPSVSAGISGKFANEGQSDYFATLKCAREMWKNDDNAAIMANVTIPQTVTTMCQKTWDTAQDIALCQRSAMGGKALGDTLGSLPTNEADRMTTDFDRPDPSVVSSTYSAHPKAQCRLDTYFAGALCGKSTSEGVSFSDEFAGTCNTSRGDDLGARPLCWFKPSGT